MQGHGHDDHHDSLRRRFQGIFGEVRGGYESIQTHFLRYLREDALRLIMLIVPAVLFTAAPIQAHTWEEVQADFDRMQLQPSEAIKKLTRVAEQLKGTSEGEMAHAAQHDLLFQSQRQANKERCTKLRARMPSIDRKIASLKQEGRLSEVEKLELRKDESDALIKTNCNFID